MDFSLLVPLSGLEVIIEETKFRSQLFSPLSPLPHPLLIDSLNK
ncbi:hypothetical protein BFG60_4256 [Microcystis aeruginosa NIES-98]|nr:hypothetical protein BFG60_4256 [Microcystis aeruginosa NIES-98]